MNFFPRFFCCFIILFWRFYFVLAFFLLFLCVFYLCVWVYTCMYTWAPFVYLMSTEARRRHWIPSNKSYRQLWVTIWELDMELWTYRREAPLNSEPCFRHEMVCFNLRENCTHQSLWLSMKGCLDQRHVCKCSSKQCYLRKKNLSWLWRQNLMNWVTESWIVQE